MKSIQPVNKFLISFILFFINFTVAWSQTAIEIAPGESIQIFRNPTISILPITDVSIEILGEDSLYVSGIVDSFSTETGTTKIKTYYTLSVSFDAPIQDLAIQVLLVYKAGDALTQNVSEDFIIDTSVLPSIVAIFSGDVLEGATPLIVQFNNESTGSIIGYLWDFGDSTTSSEQNPQHTYQVPGKYSVSLTVYNFSVQNKMTKQDYINVLEPTSLKNRETPKSHGFHLSQNYPNPFNPVTTINYSLSKTGTVKLLVYNIHGQLVKTLVNEKQQQGLHSIYFDASHLASGIYIYKLMTRPTGDAAILVQTRRMILLR